MSMTRSGIQRVGLMVGLICANDLPVPGHDPEVATGGEYSLKWLTIDNGGGTSFSIATSLHGTIGQPDASAVFPVTSGAYALTGGFWATQDPRPDALFSSSFE